MYEYRIREYSFRSLKQGRFFPANTSLVQCISGSGVVEINSRRLEIRSGMNFLLSSTTLAYIISVSSDIRCVVLDFATRFIIEHCPYVTNEIFDTITSVSPSVYSSEDVRFGNLTFEQLMMTRRMSDKSIRRIVVANLLSNYLFSLYESLRGQVEREISAPSTHIDALLINFWMMCKEEHLTHRKVSYYAERLNISPRYLHRISKAHFKISPKQVIDHCLLNSARRLLITTTKTSQEISIILGFPDQTTFGQFFKRNTGLSPLQYRNRQNSGE